jgi:NAD(P)-dependent dehydrogenase (short-subunit alcohol dehydrogenase family)
MTSARAEELIGGASFTRSKNATVPRFRHSRWFCSVSMMTTSCEHCLTRPRLRGSGVRVHALCPGRVVTDMQAQYAGAKIGMPPERVAQRIVAIASENAGRHNAVITLG